MEYVGARVYILESVNTKLVGTVGIITAVSKNCFFLAADEFDKPTNESTSSRQKKIDTVMISTGALSTGNNNTSETPTSKDVVPVALTIVKATTTLGIVLPSLHSKHKPSRELFADDSMDLTDPAARTDTVEAPDKSGYKFDHNEKVDGGRICVLHGKHFMPHCKYE